MGVWGPALYQNDIAIDVKGEFEELINAGKTAQEITCKLTSDYKGIMGNVDEEPSFWFALADTQWNLGVLLPYVKEKALNWIESELDYDVLKCSEYYTIDQRTNALCELKAKLNLPQPLEKKAKSKSVYKCQWKIGDVFAYQLESELAKKRGLCGRYFLIQKVDETTWYPGHIVPIVYVKITKDGKLPINEEEYNKLEYVQTSFTKYEDRFWPIDMNCPQEDLAKKSQINYCVDEYGYLPQYRVTLLNTSKRVVPEKLIYVGNYVNYSHPPREFIPHSKVNIRTVSWKKLNETFETIMIKQYCGHNLRELSIYRNKNA